MMKSRILIILFSLCTTLLSAFPVTDTISSPPVYASSLSGPTEACVEETSIYTCDLPLGCTPMWYINSIFQDSLSNIFEITWAEFGDFIVELTLVCDTVTIQEGSITVLVSNTPDTPTPIIGDDYVCIGTTSYYTTEVGEGESVLWKVDGIIQVSDSASMSYYWAESGNHLIEVRSQNDCGLSYPQYLDVLVTEMPVVDLGNDTTIFSWQVLQLDAGNSGSSYLWSTGETTKTIFVSETGYYEVVVSNPCGDNNDGINVDVIVGQDERSSGRVTVILMDNYVSVNMMNNKIILFQIFDIFGRLVKSGNNISKIYLPQNGVFYLKVTTSERLVFTHKFIK